MNTAVHVQPVLNQPLRPLQLLALGGQVLLTGQPADQQEAARLGGPFLHLVDEASVLDEDVEVG